MKKLIIICIIIVLAGVCQGRETLDYTPEERENHLSQWITVTFTVQNTECSSTRLTMAVNIGAFVSGMGGMLPVVGVPIFGPTAFGLGVASIILSAQGECVCRVMEGKGCPNACINYEEIIQAIINGDTPPDPVWEPRCMMTGTSHTFCSCTNKYHCSHP